MMVFKQKKIKLTNEDTTTRRYPDSTLGIYLTAVKVEKCIQVADNMIEKEDGKKVTAKKTATGNVHLQLKGSEAFDRRINSMNSLSLSTNN